MDGCILDTSVLSICLDSSHSRHDDIQTEFTKIEKNAVLFLSTISLGELEFGVRLAKVFGGRPLPVLEQMLIDARRYGILDVTSHTSASYGELKSNLAETYLADASRRGRRRWVEDWIDKTSGKRLQIDENDLWICAQAKERDLLVVTADKRMQRIADADTEVRLRII